MWLNNHTCSITHGHWCMWLWISDTCVHTSMDPLSVRVWVEMGVVKFHIMTLFVKVNCFPAPQFLLRNLYWIFYEIILSTLHRPASGSDDLEVECGMCWSATLRECCYLKCAAVCLVYTVKLLWKMTAWNTWMKASVLMFQNANWV